MPRNGSGVYSKPAGTTAVAGTVIESAKYNSAIDDIATDLNLARPITAGGTGGTSTQSAIDSVFDGTAVIDDSDLRVSDPSDRTKIVRLDAGRVSTATVRVMNAPDRDINISGVPRGHAFGLTPTTNVTDATNDVDVAAGEAADDSATPWCMVLASALTKRLDAAWAVGSGNGGLDTGSVGNNPYGIWLIQRSDTGVTDALFSLSFTSPTMPTNYDRKRLIGRLTRAAGVNGLLGSLINEISGSNANGAYIRRPDGTQICYSPNTLTSGAVTTAAGAIFTNAAGVTWTYPVAFASTPAAFPGRAGSSARWATAVFTDLTTCNFRIFSTGSSATDIAFDAMAIGKWY